MTKQETSDTMSSDPSNDDVIHVSKPEFSSESMERLFFWARDQVASIVAHTPEPTVPLGELGERAVLGAFVSFKKRGRLRSCMGYMSEGVSLSVALSGAARSAAKDDPRFPPIDACEFYDLDMEVWALGSMREIQASGEARRDAVQVGRDGIQIQGRGRRGLLLPSVPVEMNWDVDRFLEGVCDKAGLARGSWKQDDVRLFAFEGVSFKKPFVWLVSRNPELAKLVADLRANVSEESDGSSNARPIFSLSPSLFQWRAPNVRETSVTSVSDELSQQVRRPAVAGMFYPRTSSEQISMIESFEATFSQKTSDVDKKRVSAALAPHAGWIFSGRLATETLCQIEEPETVVVFAPKHRAEGANFAVMPYGTWDFGGGRVENDLDFVRQFVESSPRFRLDPVAHRSEHSIEVQLPFLKRYFPNVKVVGVLIGRSTRAELTELAAEFSAFLTRREKDGHTKPLLLISSDMNHYASDAATRIIDKKATDAIESLNPDSLYDVVMREGITMCGVLPAYFVLSTLKNRGELKRAIKIGYETSGDASGDLERVVGYTGYLFG